ncbi:Calcineurin-like phosphoesterase [Neorhodopirellula lusitana]|uniref:Calcineurin-like phosphoesterase n=1 Tax=Neorhodopirellula lusitana TaxID=445327 RepID=A0ABY1Q6N7_9BACT|nr:metallophosphoesterase [Neorhodopirellula lusitana]SMP61374.1 Calcineurin-like phosphoesterase [Neorhodopirellula lusitana]
MERRNRLQAFDIIGDIHGNADQLKRLLVDVGYTSPGKGYWHRNRKIVFVGDFVDRSPAIGEVVAIARAMVEEGGCFGGDWEPLEV